ncbi:FAD-binding oxidoreductase [Jidongwangia harbinensis]|uniref:FAD-binding oxidoreductase n=1 Tax=Jidongwangia harbinensis TaxID=2878561 RepID=UPI001CD9FAD0|nr:FAD-binding oxidoreductase [Jidongwangia harbinensis]MCA2214346.1 FAD-binding oxidoreductase [Jidongwangia harbinensis]
MGDLADLTRPAGDDDAVAGVPARLVAAPASTEEASAVLAAAAAAGLAVVVRGGGSKLDWGMPPERLDLILDTRRLAGVVEHAAGDLITVVRAGTPTDDLDLPGQQLALDRPVPGATVGGTVAVNTSGPRRVLYGTARDLLIGMTVVRPDGRVAHAGGKVVKNVAGYDLAKLFTGSYGTLGLITECAFRLHPRPAATAVVCAPAPDPAAAGRLAAAVRDAQVVPSAVEVDAPPGGPVEVAALVEGSVDGVAERAAVLHKVLGDQARDGVPEWWGTLPWRTGQVGIKLTAPLSRVPALLTEARATGAAVTVRGSAGAGVLYAGLPADPPGDVATVVERLRAAAVRAEGHVVVLTAPPAVRQLVDLWGPVGGLALMRRVKDQFDPEHRFAPGRFVGGI